MDLLKHTESIVTAVAALNGFARRGTLHCRACDLKCDQYHLLQCEATKANQPVNLIIWSQINRNSLCRLKENKVVTESITVPATLISTAEAVNRMIPLFAYVRNFDCITNSTMAPSAKRRPPSPTTTLAPESSAPSGITIRIPLTSPPKGDLTHPTRRAHTRRSPTTPQYRVRQTQQTPPHSPPVHSLHKPSDIDHWSPMGQRNATRPQ